MFTQQLSKIFFSLFFFFLGLILSDMFTYDPPSKYNSISILFFNRSTKTGKESNILFFIESLSFLKHVIYQIFRYFINLFYHFEQARNNIAREN